MEMNELVSLFTNTGTTIVILAYFIYRDFKFMTQLQTTLNTLVTTVDTLKDVVTGGTK